MEDVKMRDDIAVRFVLEANDTSHFLKGIVRSGLVRDPVDVIADLRSALTVFEEAFERCYQQRSDVQH